MDQCQTDLNFSLMVLLVLLGLFLLGCGGGDSDSSLDSAEPANSAPAGGSSPQGSVSTVGEAEMGNAGSESKRKPNTEKMNSSGNGNSGVSDRLPQVQPRLKGLEEPLPGLD